VTTAPTVDTGGEPEREPAGPSDRLRGRVSEFDEHEGLGTVVANDGRPYRFHCIEIADGSRSIPVGADVSFTIAPRFGRFEAAEITR
jgi:CspA family cold shock protein